MKKSPSVLLIIALLFQLSGCCPAVECVCSEVVITINSNDPNYRIYKTDKNFTPLDSFHNVFYQNNGLYSFDLKGSFLRLNSTDSLQDYNYLFKNLTTQKLDTLSAIRYALKPYSFTCVKCLGVFDYVKKCNEIVNPHLMLNKTIIHEFTVNLN